MVGCGASDDPGRARAFAEGPLSDSAGSQVIPPA
jgi:hypothetical protein